jgi:hypothetical protein
MENLRSGIRAAFEREQAMHPPEAALRENLVASVAARPLRESHFQRTALVAAILIAALLVSTFLYTRSTAPATPAGYGPPPAGVQLFYVRDPSQANRLLAYDWSGRQRGAVTLPSEADLSAARTAPDGSGFALDYGTDWFLDRLGNYVGPADPLFHDGGAWADDNRHVCFVTHSVPGGALSLVTLVPGQAGSTTTSSLQGFSGSVLYVQACNVHSDIAVLRVSVYTGIVAKRSDAEVVTVRLSSGAILDRRNGVPVTSPDAAYVALLTDSATIQIYRSTDLVHPVSVLDSYASLWGFSGNSSRLLVTSQPATGLPEVEVLDWKTGRVTWRHDLTSAGFGGWLARPAGGDFAVAVTSLTNDCGPTSVTCTNPASPFTGIIIVHPDGTTTRIPDRDPIAW